MKGREGMDERGGRYMYLHVKSCRKPPLEMAYSIRMSRVGTILQVIPGPHISEGD